MKLRHLEIFAAVIECSGVSRASKHLNMSQPAVSAAIRALEEELSVALFERSSGSRTVRPTGVAMRLYVRARDILQRCDDARKSVAVPDERPPKIRVGALQTLPASAVAAFHAKLVRSLPEWRWAIREGGARSLADALKDDRVDIAWTVVEESALDARVLWREPYVAMLAKHHPLAKRGNPSLCMSELNGQPIVLRGRCELPRFALQDAGLSVRPAARAERDELALSMVACGLGFAIAPRSLATSDVVALPVDDLRLSRQIGLKWRPTMSPAAIDAIAAVLTT